LEIGGRGEHGQVAPLLRPRVAGEPCLDGARDQVELARADRDDDDRTGMVLAPFGELAQKGGKGVDVVGDDDPAVMGGEPEYFVVGAAGARWFLVERAYVVAARGESGADLWTRDVVVEQEPQRLPAQATMNG
jgi:hypothetical protein